MTTTAPEHTDDDQPVPDEQRTDAEAVATEPDPVDAEAKESEDDDEEEILDLRSLAPTRRLVRLAVPGKPEGAIFEICNLDDFGVETQHQLMAWGRRYQTLMNSGDDVDEVKAKDSARIRFLMESIFEEVLAPAKGMPEGRFDKVKATLKDSEKMKVVQAFTAGPLLERQEAQMSIIRRLIDREAVTQEQVDEVLAEIRLEVAQAQDRLMSGT